MLVFQFNVCSTFCIALTDCVQLLFVQWREREREKERKRERKRERERERERERDGNVSLVYSFTLTFDRKT